MSGDGYDRDREPYDNNARGRIWENGSDRYFRDCENGYSKPSREQELPTPGEARRYDKQRGDPRKGPVRAIEDKSGAIDGNKDHSQLKRDYDLIRDGKVDHLLLRSVEGETISRTAQHLIQDLQRDFPEKFTHQIISRSDAREIWARGLEREPSPQLELPGVGEQARQQKAKQREARQQEREREREDRSREREPTDQTRTREDERDKGKPPAVAKERAGPTAQTKDVREREEAQARAMVESLGLNLSKEQREQVQTILREGRENQRKDPVREIEAGRGQQPPAPPATPHRTPEQERENARAIAKEAGLSPEITGILGLNTNNPHPTIDIDQARLHAESEAARMKNATRERERARKERERNSRYRGD
ncbi:hypothetical protein OG874_42895 [Nocardia sp. NBC_00565]|uniref:hypothetical protein n=1 Tax=Nocardia sp. NBC_00565 TaxID=2975993 RepID=UPI002E820683|nr:hypothetical protein [Nocardia sp. NBC_00565]WUC03334.1 hypothetical protein OG874_42895 [Nocardia sp. NBC_00565]